MAWRMGLVLGLTLFFVGGVFAAEKLEVPITVHEAIRRGAEGIERRSEPVTVGIPFPDSLALKEIDGRPALEVVGAGEYQFRTLARWPSGNVRWALADFQADCPAGQMVTPVKVVAGPGVSKGKNLAQELPARIEINTGPMQVTIARSTFRLFDIVVVAGKHLVKPDVGSGIFCIGPDGAHYTAAKDDNVEVVLEENGPVRCVVRAEGTHRNASGRMLDFTVRMHFYRGKSRVRVFYTLRNASSLQVERAQIRGLFLATKLNLKGPAAVALAKHDGVLKEDLAGGESIAYYQGFSTFPQHVTPTGNEPGNRPRGLLKDMASQEEGYEIKKGEQMLASGNKDQYPELAFLDLSSADGAGVTVGIRYAAGLWPTGLSAGGDGTVVVALWPPRGEGTYSIPFSTHNTREVMFSFHVAPAHDPAGEMFRFQYPLVGKCPVDWYNANVRGVYPLYYMVPRIEEEKYAEEKGWKSTVQNRAVKLTIPRYHYWGLGGFRNQHDEARVAICNFLRETTEVGRGGDYYLFAEARFNYNADWAVAHADGPEPVGHAGGALYPVRRTGARIEGKPPYKDWPKDSGVRRKQHYEWEHRHWYGMPLYYYLTGDERIRETAQYYAVQMKGTHPFQHAANPTLSHIRIYSWAMFTLAAAYDFTGDEEYIPLIRKNFHRLLEQQKGIQVHWDRGGVYGGSGEGSRRGRGCKPFMIAMIHDALLNCANVLPRGDADRERMLDVTEGTDEFISRECLFENGERKRVFWIPYVYNLDDRSQSSGSFMSDEMAGHLHVMSYLRHGREVKANLFDNVLEGCYDTDAWGGSSALDLPGAQALLYVKLRPRQDTTPPPAIRDLSAQALRSGTVLLSWTNPRDALHVQTRYSTKRIVANLDFDADKRTWAYDPATHDNWWAALSVVGMPRVCKGGAKDSVKVEGLSAGTYYFAVRTWDEASNRSRVSNLARVEVK